MAAVAAIFWPGLPMFDTVAQYGQVLSDEVDDWHPPVMVRLWQLLHPLGSGTEPMFVLQVALYAVGFMLLVAALVRAGRSRAAAATAVLALSPLLIGWQMVVIKDAQMQAALLAAVGIVAFFRLAQRPVPPFAIAIAAVLLVYATLVRANAVFVTVPLALMWLKRPTNLLWRASVGLAAIAAVIFISPVINHRVLGGDDSGVAKTQPLFDLAAIAVGTSDPGPFTPGERAIIAQRHCVKNYFWDPLGDPSACGPVVARLQAESQNMLYLDLAESAAAHPIAYAEHRLGHWNSSERWLVPPGLPEAGPPDEGEGNDLGLASPPNPAMPKWQSVAADEAATPLGWPIFWTALSLCLLPAALRRRQEPVGGLALSLLASALVLEASFLVVSIASDLRYHLWPMMASALALILLSDRLVLKRREWIGAGAALALVVGGGVISRTILPDAPDTYQGMIHAVSG